MKQSTNRIWLIIFLGLLSALAPLSTDMYLPALPAMPQEFDAATSTIQLTLTMTMAGMAIGQMAAGPISDLKGRRIPLIIGMLAFAISSLVCVFAKSIELFLCFRFFQGLFGAAGIVISRAIARDVCEGPELTRFFSLLMLVNGLAPILAPVIGGQVLLFTTWRGIFLLLTVIGFLLMAASFRFRESLPESRRISGLSDSFKSFFILIKDRYFLGHCLMQCCTFAAFFAYISGSSFLLQDIYRVSPQDFSAIFGGIGALIMIAGMIPARLAGRVPDVLMLGWSLLQALMGSLLFLLCILSQAPLGAVLLSLAVTTPMISILGASSFSLAMRAHGKIAGSASALIGFCSMLAGGLMAPLVGIAGSSDARPMAVIMLLGNLLGFIIFYYVIYARHRKGGKIGSTYGKELSNE